MLSYIYKGWYAGGTMLARALRTLTCIPGIGIDVIVALFWMPNFTSYWADGKGAVYYDDGTNVTFWQGVFGWVGIVLGYLIGCPVGAAIGAALYIPDLILKGIIDLRIYIYNAFYQFTDLILNAEIYNGFAFHRNPGEFIENRLGNFFVAIIGPLIAAIPLLISSIVEFLLPFLNLGLSRYIKEASSVLANVVGVVLVVLAIIPAYLLNRGIDLIVIARNNAFTALAILMGKFAYHFNFNKGRDEDLISSTFASAMDKYSAMTWAEIVFGIKNANTATVVNTAASTTTVVNTAASTTTAVNTAASTTTAVNTAANTATVVNTAAGRISSEKFSFKESTVDTVFQEEIPKIPPSPPYNNEYEPSAPPGSINPQ